MRMTDRRPRGTGVKISVVIAAYNAESTIGETIASVLAQTRPADEIVVADDCSTDATRDVVASYPGVTLLMQARNGGPGIARNAAAAASRGDVLAFVDADDLWHPDHLASAVALLERFPECGFSFSANDRFGTLCDTQLPDFPANQPLAVRDKLLEGNQIHLLTVVIRRALFDLAGGFDAALRGTEDYDLWLRCTLHAKAVYTGQSTTSYRMHHGQLNQQLPRMFAGTWHARLKLLDDVRRMEPQNAEAMEQRLGQIWANSLYTAWAARSRNSLDVMLAMSRSFSAATCCRTPLAATTHHLAHADANRPAVEAGTAGAAPIPAAGAQALQHCQAAHLMQPPSSDRTGTR